VKRKICIIVGPAFVLYILYRNQMSYLQENGFDITAIASAGEEHQWLRDQNIKTFEIPIIREPSFLRDIISLFKLILHFTFHRYDIVHVSTPKASLLGSIAARLTFHNTVIYTLRGRAYENYSGIKLKIFEKFEWLTCKLATKVISISKEMGADVVQKKLCPQTKMNVIGSGSSNGVDLNVFTRTPELIQVGIELRKKANIPENALIILSVGRIRSEKGINELVRVFNKIITKRDDIYLVLQGHYEEVDPLDDDVNETIESCAKIHHIHFNKNVSVAYAAADILAFPSHREGFGNVAIEASAMELPIVSYDVVGCRESVSDQVSGVLVEKENEHELYDALLLLINDKALREKMGKMGRERVEREFKSEVVWDGLIKFYNSALKTN
jgi:glycosyltransferase involved in cell wall biosynthesis